MWLPVMVASFVFEFIVTVMSNWIGSTGFAKRGSLAAQQSSTEAWFAALEPVVPMPGPPCQHCPCIVRGSF